MAGKRQHFLPRFLKKGFASRIKKQEIYTWVFSKGKKPYEANLRNVGLENFFYGSEDEHAADRLITEAENKFSEVIEKLRTLPSTQEINESLVPEFVAHLIIRTKHFRSSMNAGGQVLAGILVDNLKSPDDFYKFLMAISQGEDFKNSIRKNIEKQAANRMNNEQIEQNVKLIMEKTPEIARSKANEGFNTFKMLFQRMYDEMPSIVEGAHNKTLSREATPRAYKKKFSGYKWQVHVLKKGSLLLGDIGPICNFGLTDNFKPYVFTDGRVEQFFLPISKTHLIIGSSCEKFDVPDIKKINFASVSLSQNYFISSQNTDFEQNLIPEIGKNATNLNNRENILKLNKFKKELFGKENSSRKVDC
jgi:hypothetical protein